MRRPRTPLAIPQHRHGRWRRSRARLPSRRPRSGQSLDRRRRRHTPPLAGDGRDSGAKVKVTDGYGEGNARPKPVEPPERIELSTFSLPCAQHAGSQPDPTRSRGFRSAAVGSRRALLATVWATPSVGAGCPIRSRRRGIAAADVTGRVYCGCMAAPHVDGDHAGKRWGVEVPFDALDSMVSDPGRLAAYRQRVKDAGRAAATRLRSPAADQ